MLSYNIIDFISIFAIPRLRRDVGLTSEKLLRRSNCNRRGYASSFLFDIHEQRWNDVTFK